MRVVGRGTRRQVSEKKMLKDLQRSVDSLHYMVYTRSNSRIEGEKCMSDVPIEVEQREVALPMEHPSILDTMENWQKAQKQLEVAHDQLQSAQKQWKKVLDKEKKRNKEKRVNQNILLQKKTVSKIQENAEIEGVSFSRYVESVLAMYNINAWPVYLNNEDIEGVSKFKEIKKIRVFKSSSILPDVYEDACQKAKDAQIPIYLYIDGVLQGYFNRKRA